MRNADNAQLFRYTITVGSREWISARAGGQAGLFPEFFPLPDASGFVKDGIAELVGQQQNLAAMVSFVREHVGEHGAAGGPG